ncbi:hypothetical protein LCGC14_1487190 [marine sediment metagenome]|uniref:Uncharacterized protein n=1 Tax=marine sediment metagenome TaxID=412755 RepID=A0A0F9J8J9_9ZZZZ
MIMRPCMQCSFRDDCEKRDGIRAAVKGVGLTTISFTCEKRTAHIPPGTRVKAIFRTDEENGCEDDGSPRFYESEIEINGTVMRHKDFKAVVWFDELIQAGRETTIARLWSDRLTVLDKPPKELCSECGRPEGEKNSDKWNCWKCEGRLCPAYLDEI